MCINEAYYFMQQLSPSKDRDIVIDIFLVLFDELAPISSNTNERENLTLICHVYRGPDLYVSFLQCSNNGDWPLIIINQPVSIHQRINSPQPTPRMLGDLISCLEDILNTIEIDYLLSICCSRKLGNILNILKRQCVCDGTVITIIGQKMYRIGKRLNKQEIDRYIYTCESIRNWIGPASVWLPRVLICSCSQARAIVLPQELTILDPR